MTRNRTLLLAIIAGFALVLLSGCTTGASSVSLDVADVGWGPPRPVSDGAGSPSYPALNSVRDSSKDETQFIFLRDQETGVGRRDARPSIGEVIQAIAYFDNSGGAKSTGTTMTIDAPGSIWGRAAVKATIQSSNAIPGTVWSSLALTPPDSDGAVALRLVRDSARLVVPARGVDIPLSQDLFSGGTPIGCSGPNGSVDAGCSGYVTFEIRIDRPNFEVMTQIRESGESIWRSSVKARKNGHFELRINFRNTGSTQLDDVTLSVAIPTGAWIDGTVRWGNDLHPEGFKAVGDVSGPGLNVGSYNPTGGAFVVIPIQVGPVVYCAGGRLEIVGKANTHAGYKTSAMILPVATSVTCV